MDRINKKIIVRQIDPESQESPLSLMDDSLWPENILVLGNRNYRGHMEHSKYGELYERILQSYDDMCEYYEALKDKETSWYKNVTELFQDFFSKSEFDAINVNLNNKKNIHEFKLLLDKRGTHDDFSGEVYIEMLSLLTGFTWDKCGIRGCVQSDYNEILYPVELVSDDAIEIFEMEYFNMGTEWLFDYGTGNECGIYCHGYNDDEIKKEIADAFRVNVDDISLEKFTGYTKVCNYEFV